MGKELMNREAGERLDLAGCYSCVAAQLQSGSLDRGRVKTILENAAVLLLQPRSISSQLNEAFFVKQVEKLARQATLDSTEQPDETGVPDSELNQIYQQFHESFTQRLERLRRERAEAGSLIEELRQQPVLRRKWLVRNVRRFQSFGLAEHILEDLWRVWHNEPREGVDLSELALEISEQLDPELHGGGAINDLRARCLAALGNSRRLLGQRTNIEEVFQASLYYLEQGTGNPIEKAYFLQLKASWRHTQGRIDQAVELLEEAASVQRSLDLPDREANVLIQMAIFIGLAGRHGEAMEILERLQNDRRRLSSRSIFYAHHNYTTMLSEAGRYEEGLERIAEGRHMATQLGDRLDEQRVNWLEGQLLSQVGRMREAEPLLREARDHFLATGKGLEAVGPALDLIRLRLNRSDIDGGEIAEDLLTLFASREIPQNVLPALFHLSKALQKNEASLGLVDEVEAFRDKAQANPAAVFEPRAEAQASH